MQAFRKNAVAGGEVSVYDDMHDAPPYVPAFWLLLYSVTMQLKTRL